MTNWKYRLARWLIGYRPYRLPDGDGAYIVIVGGPASMIMTPKTFEMQNSVTLPTLDPALRDDDHPFTGNTPAARSGTFSGTL